MGGTEICGRPVLPAAPAPGKAAKAAAETRRCPTATALPFPPCTMNTPPRPPGPPAFSLAWRRARLRDTGRACPPAAGGAAAEQDGQDEGEGQGGDQAGQRAGTTRRGSHAVLLPG